MELQALISSLSLRTLAALWIWMKVGKSQRKKTQMDGVQEGNHGRQDMAQAGGAKEPDVDPEEIKKLHDAK